MSFEGLMPYFPGGYEALQAYYNSSFQEILIEAEEKKFNGSVIVMFIVEKDGSIDSVSVLKGIDSTLNMKIRCMKFQRSFFFR